VEREAEVVPQKPTHLGGEVGKNVRDVDVVASDGENLGLCQIGDEAGSLTGKK
jgi:hypothetical protein